MYCFGKFSVLFIFLVEVLFLSVGAWFINFGFRLVRVLGLCSVLRIMELFEGITFFIFLSGLRDSGWGE